MVFFHFFYDLNVYRFVSIDFQREPFWFYLPRLIVTLFLFSVGVSLALAHRDGIKRIPYLKRLAKIGIGAIIITISTYFMFPKSWVYFGTLHCIFFVTIFITPLRHFPKVSLILALIILSLEAIGHDIPFWIMDHASMDYIPLFPWIAVGLIGIFAKSMNVHRIAMPNNRFTRLFIVPGRHAFIIYIIHQPILFSCVYLAHRIVNSLS
ncbi:PF07786 family protein [Bacteriovorax sp. DB6_IX]|nr:PF07786 family protein [Bacteriovorax sp. DB6_IX]